jgi:hypothetical protein
MSKSVRAPSHEFFYSRNVFQIDFNTTSILCPPTCANGYIRYLAVRLQVLNAECWDALITFAATTAAQYPKLCHVTVQFEWRYSEAGRPRRTSPLPRRGGLFGAGLLVVHCFKGVCALAGTAGLTREEAERRITGAISFKQ